MWQYHVQNVIKPIAFFFFCGVSGLSVNFSGIDSPVTLVRVCFSLFGISFLGFGLVFCLREIHEIRVTHEGEIIFVRVVGVTRLRAADIRRLEGRYKADYSGPSWSLRVDYMSSGRQRNVELCEFDDVRAFAERVRALTPSLEITGTWPMREP
jgi:hypothetical protein